LAEVAAALAEADLKGECTLVLSCPPAPTAPKVDVAGRLLQVAQEENLGGRRLTDRVAAELQAPRRQVYQTYLQLKAGKLLP
jgi:16S rRNA C1402 (ribose-2'-O) methylase RsmI